MPTGKRLPAAIGLVGEVKDDGGIGFTKDDVFASIEQSTPGVSKATIRAVRYHAWASFSLAVVSGGDVGRLLEEEAEVEQCGGLEV